MRNHLRIRGSRDLTCSSSRSDLMSSDVFVRLPHVRRVSVSSILEFFMCHFPSRTPCASCPPKKKRISHGLNKLVTDLSNKDDDNEQETSEMKFEEFALKTNVLTFASRSKAKTRPRRRTSACSSARIIPICERSWTDIEPEDSSSIACPVSKQLSTLLRHGHLPREEDGAIEFWRLKGLSSERI